MISARLSSLHSHRPNIILHANPANFINPRKPIFNTLQYTYQFEERPTDQDPPNLFKQFIKDTYTKTTSQVKSGISTLAKIPKEIAAYFFIGTSLSTLATINIFCAAVSILISLPIFIPKDPLLDKIKQQSDLLSKITKSKIDFSQSNSTFIMEEKYSYGYNDKVLAIYKQTCAFSSGVCLEAALHSKNILGKILLVSLAAYCLKEAFQSHKSLKSKIIEIANKKNDEAQKLGISLDKMILDTEPYGGNIPPKYKLFNEEFMGTEQTYVE